MDIVSPETGGSVSVNSSGFRSGSLFVVYVLMFLAFLAVLNGAWQYSKRGIGIDFYQFWIVTQARDKYEGADLYSRENMIKVGGDYYNESLKSQASLKHRAVAQRKKNLEIYASPFLYTLFYFFNLKDYDFDYRVFHFVCIASFVFAVVLISRLLQYPYLFTMAVLILFFSSFAPFLSDLTVGNVNLIQLGLLASFLWLQKNSSRWRYADFLGGAVLGLSVMFKPYIVFAILLLAVWLFRSGSLKRLLRLVTGIATGGAAAFIAGSLFFGTPASWFSWLEIIRHLVSDFPSPLAMGNMSISMIIEEWSGREISRYISPLLTVTVLSASFFVIWKAPRKAELDSHLPGDSLRAENFVEFKETFLLIGLGLTVFILTSRLVWLHHQLLIVPLALYLLGAGDRPFINTLWANRIYKLIVVAAVLVIARIPVEMVYSFKSVMSKAFISQLGVSALFVMGLVELFYANKQTAAEAG